MEKQAVLRIGLTGGIASGKSTVADRFASLGAVVIDTDQIARQLVEPGSEAFSEIVDAFGQTVLEPDGSLDRGRLRALVFQDDALRHKLEAILHPRIRRRTLETAEAAGGPYQILVVPLLVETGFRQLVNRVLVVDCPECLQQERLMARDGTSADQAGQIMAAQIGRQERLAAADDVIHNDGSPADTAAQVQALHERYVTLATAN